MSEFRPSRNEQSPLIVLTLRPERDDSVRGLRWLLKTALRRFGLRCISVREIDVSVDTSAASHNT
jgi:hypothetical protein